MLFPDQVIHVLIVAKIIIQRIIILKRMVILLISFLIEEEKEVEVLVEEGLGIKVITMIKYAHIVELMNTQLINVI